MRSPSATRLASALAALALVFTPAAAQEAAPQAAPDTVPNINSETAGFLGVDSSISQEYAAPEGVAGPGGPFATAVRVRGSDGPEPWSVQGWTPVGGDIAEGDTIIVTFIARAERAAGLGSRLPIRVQRRAPPYPGFLETTFELTGEWKQFCAYGIAPQDFNGRESAVVLHLSTGEQVIDLTPILVFNLGAFDPAKVATCTH